MKEIQNSKTQREIYVGKEKGKPVYKTVDVVTTMTKLFIYMNGKCIGSAGVSRAEDFDFDALYTIAREKSGSKISA